MKKYITESYTTFIIEREDYTTSGDGKAFGDLLGNLFSFKGFGTSMKVIKLKNKINHILEELDLIFEIGSFKWHRIAILEEANQIKEKFKDALDKKQVIIEGLEQAQLLMSSSKGDNRGNGNIMEYINTLTPHLNNFQSAVIKKSASEWLEIKKQIVSSLENDNIEFLDINKFNDKIFTYTLDQKTIKHLEEEFESFSYDFDESDDRKLFKKIENAWKRAFNKLTIDFESKFNEACYPFSNTIKNPMTEYRHSLEKIGRDFDYTRFDKKTDVKNKQTGLLYTSKIINDRSKGKNKDSEIDLYFYDTDNTKDYLIEIYTLTSNHFLEILESKQYEEQIHTAKEYSDKKKYYKKNNKTIILMEFKNIYSGEIKTLFFDVDVSSKDITTFRVIGEENNEAIIISKEKDLNIALELRHTEYLKIIKSNKGTKTNETIYDDKTVVSKIKMLTDLIDKNLGTKSSSKIREALSTDELKSEIEKTDLQIFIQETTDDITNLKKQLSSEKDPKKIQDLNDKIKIREEKMNLAKSQLV